MNYDCYHANRLPDVEMYGGETSPWEVVLVNDDYSLFTASSVSNYSCKLSLLPYKVVAGLGNNTIDIAPILVKDGVCHLNTLTGCVNALFTFSSSDTIALRGKYTYQIEVARGDDLAIGQGALFIRSNIHR